MAEPNRPRIIILANLKPHYIEPLRSLAPGWDVLAFPKEEVALPYAGGCRILACWGASFPGRLFAAAPIEWLHTLSAGVEGLLVPEVVNSQVIITNSRGIHATPMCEHVFALILSFARSLPQLYRHQQARVWQRLPVDEVRGKTLGLIGLGAIGGELARVAAAFGMKVLAVRRSPAPVAGVDLVLGPRQLDRLLEEADYVVIALPLTPETHSLIGERELRLMKPTAVLINVSRGEIVDEPALIRALREGWIAGAGLDVFRTEPLPAGSELYDLENVIITPHLAGSTPHYYRRAMELFGENLRRYLAGAPLLNVVDKARGY